MDINNLSSYMMLEPSQLIRAQRFVEHGLGMFDRDEELIESYLKEHLAGGTLDYAMHLLGESTTSYMGVQIHNQGGSFSAPTAGVYNVKSRPELKSKVKEKILKRNERENKAEKLKTKKEEVENVEELYKGKHGQSEKQYADSRSQGGKMVSGDSKMSGAEYSHGRRVKAANPGMQPDVGGKTKPKSQGKMDSGTRNELKYRKANLKKEEVEVVDESSLKQARKNVGADKCWKGYKAKGTKTKNGRSVPNCVKEEEFVNEEASDAMKDRRMERGGVDGNTDYRRPAKNIATGPKKKSSGNSMSAFDKVVADLKAKHGDKAIMSRKTTKEEVVVEKKSDKDYDGDGKIETGSKEHAGAVHNAIQRKKGLKPDGKDTRKEELNLNEQEFDFLHHQLMSEGFESDDVLEAINESIEEAKVTYGHDTEQPAKKPSATKSFLSKVGKMAKEKLAKAQVKGYNKAREVGQNVKDKYKQVKQSAKNKIGKTARKIADRMGEEFELEEKTIQLKGKKKGNVIINPEVKKVEESSDDAKNMQIQKRQLQLNKQKIALQQKATSKKQSTDMHVEENLHEVDTTTRANQFGAEIEDTTLRRKKEKKSLKTFKQLSMGSEKK